VKDKKLQIQYIPIGKIKENERNARIHTKTQIELIAKSINKYGFTAPVLVDKNFVLLAGHGRIEAAKQTELKEVPAIVIPLSGNKAREYLIADNSLAQLSKWENSLLKLELTELKIGIELADLGFDDSFLNKFGVKENFKEVSAEAVAGKLAHECPKCGFKF
jgi:ParB-like chromosome segregation protein Spo0J